jgi:hypothetical protein
MEYGGIITENDGKRKRKKTRGSGKNLWKKER